MCRLSPSMSMTARKKKPTERSNKWKEKSKVTEYRSLMLSRCKNKNKKQNHRFTSLPGESKRMRPTRQAVNVYRIVTSETQTRIQTSLG